MNKYLLLSIAVFGHFMLQGQCLVNTLTINTGYDPLTNSAITPGTNGGTPVPDPHWVVTAESPAVATAIAATPITGLIEVTPGNSADIVTRLGGWAANPTGHPGNWISCLNSNTYNTDGTGVTDYNMKLSRSFRMCSDDSITIDFFIANDNYAVSSNVDGSPLLFSQPPGFLVTTYSTYTHFTQTIFLTSGIHTLSIVIDNYNTSPGADNPTGMNVYGTVASASGFESLVSEGTTACLSYVCGSSLPCNTIMLADTVHTCANTSIALTATISGTDSVLSTIWSPAAGLSDTTLLTTTATVGMTGEYYYLTMKSLQPNNLVANGDFSAGNADFSSSYLYFPPPSTILDEGDYSVDTDPHDVHTGFTSFGDHTTGTGEMMIINGGPTAVDVWCETIPVQPNTDYSFSSWFANCSAVTTGADVPILQFKINGVLIGVPSTVSAAPGTWVNFAANWNSGTNTTATICIYDATTTASGNDFVIDDISFQHYCTVKDSVYITITIPDTAITVHDTAVCSAIGLLPLNAPTGYTNYNWSTSISGSGINATGSGTYWVKSYGGCRAAVDTFHVTFIPIPVVNIGNDTGFCIGNTIVLSAPAVTGIAYLWNTGSTADTIQVASTGTYWLQASNGCVYTDSIHILVSPFPIVNLGPDITNLLGMDVPLQSLETYTAPTYQWNTGATTSSITAGTGSYWLQVTVAGCASADSINVVIKSDTFTLYNNDTAICKGQHVQAIATINPSATYQWLPTAGIAFSTFANALITPDTSAMYYLTATMAGCPPTVDSFFIDVQPSPTVYIGGNRFVCQFDTIHIAASVTPNWYTGYTYSWAPSTSLDGTTAQTVVYTPGATQNYTVTVSTSANCTGYDSARITVLPGNFGTINPDLSLCPHDSVQLTASGGGTYQWSPSTYLSDPTSPTPTIKAITTQAYSVIVTSPQGCSDTLNLNVTVWPAAVIFIDDSTRLYPGESYQMAPSTNCTTISWFPPAGLSATDISNPVASPDISTNYIITGTTEEGCVATDSIAVYVSDETIINIPNAFTPGSGTNNILYLLKKGIASLNYYRIYNRWGNLVFETRDINTGWDGSYKGQPQPMDVFVYDIEAVSNTGRIYKKTGNITLLR